MSLSNDTPTSSLHHPPRISSEVQSSAAFSLSPLLTRTLNYGELDDFHEDHELAGVNSRGDGGEDTQQLAVPEASTGTKVFCETSNLEPSVLSVTQTNTLSVFLVLFES
jgi:hypothetical protein